MLFRKLFVIGLLVLSSSQAAEQDTNKENETIKYNCAVIMNYILDTKTHLNWLEEQKEKVPKMTKQRYVDELAELMKLYNQAKGDPTMDAEAEIRWFVLMHSPAGNFYY